MSSAARITGCVIAMNEEDRIGDCLRSLDFCDELVVVDSHSRDRTREIAAALGARVIERDFAGHGPQKRFAAAAASNDWIFSLDADERVSRELRGEILALRERGFAGHFGWRNPRMSAYLGKWIRHGSWYPNHQLRLYNRRHCSWAGSEPHDKVVPEGRPGTLRGEILHYPYRTLEEHLATIDKYTTSMAAGMAERGRRASLFDVVVRPLLRFLRTYVLRLGFLEGWRGFVMAALETHYVRLKYTKLYVMRHQGPPPPLPP